MMVIIRISTRVCGCVRLLVHFLKLQFLIGKPRRAFPDGFSLSAYWYLPELPSILPRCLMTGTRNFGIMCRITTWTASTVVCICFFFWLRYTWLTWFTNHMLFRHWASAGVNGSPSTSPKDILMTVPIIDSSLLIKKQYLQEKEFMT